MYKIAITGIIGSGKSTLGIILQKKGINFISADTLTKQAISPDNLAYSPVLKLLGTQYLQKNGFFDTQKIAKTVFNNKVLLSQLESIIHPIVWKLIKQKEKQFILNKQNMIFYEIPLLFETKWHLFFDTVVVIAIDLIKQKNRLKKYRNLSPTDIKNRMQFQMPQSKKIKKADYIIWNNLSIKDLEKEAYNMITYCTKINKHENK